VQPFNDAHAKTIAILNNALDMMRAGAKRWKSTERQEHG